MPLFSSWQLSQRAFQVKNEKEKCWNARHSYTLLDWKKYCKSTVHTICSSKTTINSFKTVCIEKHQSVIYILSQIIQLVYGGFRNIQISTRLLTLTRCDMSVGTVLNYCYSCYLGDDYQTLEACFGEKYGGKMSKLFVRCWHLLCTSFSL